jgi:hypothetical protein
MLTCAAILYVREVKMERIKRTFHITKSQFWTKYLNPHTTPVDSNIERKEDYKNK